MLARDRRDCRLRCPRVERDGAIMQSDFANFKGRCWCRERKKIMNPYADLFPGNSGMAERCRRFDWGGSPIGEPAHWPAALKDMVPVLLASNQPLSIAWGRAQTLIYNDPYASILGQEHPDALGKSFLDVWDEVRADLAPMVHAAHEGQPVQMNDLQLWMTRRGYREENTSRLTGCRMPISHRTAKRP